MSKRQPGTSSDQTPTPVSQTTTATPSAQTEGVSKHIPTVPLALIFAITAAGVMVNGLTVPLLPDIQQEFDLEESAIGLFVAAGAFPGIFLAPIAGLLADRFGRRMVLVPSLICLAIGGLLSATAPTFPIMLLGRVILGVGGASPIGLAVVLISDQWQGAERSRLLGLNAAVLTILLAVYPVIGGQTGALFGFRWALAPYAFGFVVAAICWKVLQPGRSETLRVASTTNHPPKNRMQQLSIVTKGFRQPVVISTTITGFIFFGSIFGLQLTLFPLLVEETFDIGSAGRGWLLAVSAITSAVTSFNISTVRRVLTDRTMVVTGVLLEAAGYIFCGTASEVEVVIFAMVLFGAGQGLLLPTLQELITNYASSGNRAMMVSGYVGVMRLAQTAGPFAATLAASATGNNTTFIYGGGVLVVGAAAHVVLLPSTKFALPHSPPK